MGHPEIRNQTPFAVSFSFAMDEAGRPLLVVLIQASYEIAAGRSPALCETQPEASLVGELWGGDSASSSYRIEPAFAFMKPATDVVLLGHARTLGRPVTQLEVLFRVGPVSSLLRVTGDRSWVRVAGSVAASRPQAFSEMPLVYERAFGGWDLSHDDAAKHGYEARNPVGVGYRAPEGRFEEGIALPNVEDPRDLVRAYGQVLVPAGVGFVSPHWSPRRELGGTYDAAWANSRRPLLPLDFDRRFFNAASRGLVAAEYLRGGEPVVIENASLLGPLAFSLPSAAPVHCKVELRGRPDVEVDASLDTVVVDTDRHLLGMTYRQLVPLATGPHDVRTIHAEVPTNR